MKKLITCFLIGVTAVANAQVIIGDQVGTATNKSAVLLEFAANQNKGIILPYVRTIPSTPTAGTILVNASDPAKAKVQYYNGSWVDLSSGNESNISSSMTIQPPVTVTEPASAKVIIGATSSNASGVLILESTEKVMVLPQVEKVSDIVGPSAGMMVFVNKTGAKRLAVFNGSKWTYWGPN